MYDRWIIEDKKQEHETLEVRKGRYDGKRQIEIIFRVGSTIKLFTTLHVKC